MMFLFKEGHLERQDGEQLIHIAADLFDTILLPSPYLRRDIVIDGTETLFLHVFRDTEVKTWVIHEDHRIGSPCGNILLALAHVA